MSPKLSSSTDLTSIPYLNTLPASLDINAYILARKAEISNFEHEISDKSCSARNIRRVFQTVPRSMRRRTASHNIKRLPKRLRIKALKEPQYENTDPKAKKCRRLRRRLKNINYRTENFFQTRTHLWHAKRTEIQLLWGTKISIRVNDKCLKPCLRAAVNINCNGPFIHDASYYQVLKNPMIEEYLENNSYFHIKINNELWYLCHPSNNIACEFHKLPYSFFILIGPKVPEMIGYITNSCEISSFVTFENDRLRVFTRNRPDFKFKNFLNESQESKSWTAKFLNPPASTNEDMRHISFYLHQENPLNHVYYIIVPNIWALTVWRAMIYSGARFGGLEELNYVYRELSIPLFPYDFISSKSFLSMEFCKALKGDTKGPTQNKQLEYLNTFLDNLKNEPFHYSLYSVVAVKKASFKPLDVIIARSKCFNDCHEDKIFGIITRSGFSQIRGKYHGIAFCDNLLNNNFDYFVKDSSGKRNNSQWLVKLSLINKIR